MSLQLLTCVHICSQRGCVCSGGRTPYGRASNRSPHEYPRSPDMWGQVPGESPLRETGRGAFPGRRQRSRSQCQPKSRKRYGRKVCSYFFYTQMCHIL